MSATSPVSTLRRNLSDVIKLVEDTLLLVDQAEAELEQHLDPLSRTTRLSDWLSQLQLAQERFAASNDRSPPVAACTTRLAQCIGRVTGALKDALDSSVESGGGSDVPPVAAQHPAPTSASTTQIKLEYEEHEPSALRALKKRSRPPDDEDLPLEAGANRAGASAARTPQSAQIDTSAVDRDGKEGRSANGKRVRRSSQDTSTAVHGPSDGKRVSTGTASAIERNFRPPPSSSSSAASHLLELTAAERAQLCLLREPLKCHTWMKMMFVEKPGAEVTQIEIWRLYCELFSQLTPKDMMPAADVVKYALVVFPQASADVTPGFSFLIRGITRRTQEILDASAVSSSAPHPLPAQSKAQSDTTNSPNATSGSGSSRSHTAIQIQTRKLFDTCTARYRLDATSLPELRLTQVSVGMVSEDAGPLATTLEELASAHGARREELERERADTRRELDRLGQKMARLDETVDLEQRQYMFYSEMGLKLQHLKGA